MSVYLISYDLGVPETSEDYKSLIEYIKLHSWKKVLQSVWLIKTSKSVKDIRDGIKKKVDDNDRALVIDVTGSRWATLRVPKSTTEWMKKNI